jgi:halimadienyl-diphosphate synthase
MYQLPHVLYTCPRRSAAGAWGYVVRDSADEDQLSADDHAAALLDEVAADPWGDVSNSVYDTARLVSLTPSLPGHESRLEFLLRLQQDDGCWGEPDGYALVPTLSATEAILACLHRPETIGGIDTARLRRAAAAGLAGLRQWSGTRATVPDTIAVEVVVPALVAAINNHLDAAAPPIATMARLAVPDGMDPAAATRMAARLEQGGTVPQTWWASLEVLGAAAVRTDRVRPHDGIVACSPAATAAWLGDHTDPGTDGAADAARYLHRLQARGGGPVAGVTPITFFEQSWVLAALAPTTSGHTAVGDILDSLDAALGPAGAPAAPSLPPDCDDAAVVLTALYRHGRARPIDGLLGYHTGEYFRCFPSERTPSVSTNAHALETLQEAMAAWPHERSRLAPIAAATAAWLLGAQHTDGSWWDKWHASPYYATVCCVQALLAQQDTAAQRALDRAVRWALETQHADGSWGRWGGTVEETAYGVQILAYGEAGTRPGSRRAVAAGAAFLRAQPATGPHRGLWHAKDLYAPGRVIRAARLAALRAAHGMAVSGAAGPTPPPAAAAAPRLPAQRSAPNRPAPADNESAPPQR